MEFALVLLQQTETAAAYRVGTIALAVMTVVIVFLWKIREPAAEALRSWAQSEKGIAILAGIWHSVASSEKGAALLNGIWRAYVTTDEGKAVVESIINGKVRREVVLHNTARDAHYELLREYATLDELNRAIGSVRELVASVKLDLQKTDAKIEHLTLTLASERDDIMTRLDEIHRLVQEGHA